MIGRKFGRLTVTAEEGRSNDRHILWRCSCECGNTTVVKGTALRRGHTQSCGCLAREVSARSPAMISRIYPPVSIGDKFGKLTVIEFTGKNSYGKKMCLCRCECGNICEAIVARLSSGHKKSCGCYSSEFTTEQNTTHGGTGSRLFSIWSSMKTRCNNSNHKNYDRYGGRGITVCHEWEKSFETFRDWALSNGYSDDLTIDRIDNDKGYSPENCRWATWHEQRMNQQRMKKR